MGRGLPAAHLGDGTAVGTVHLESMAPYAQARRKRWHSAQVARECSICVLVGDFLRRHRARRARPGPWADLWTALRPADPGYTVDSESNPYRKRRGHTRRCIDRVVLRDPSHRWVATSIGRSAPRCCPVATTCRPLRTPGELAANPSESAYRRRLKSRALTVFRPSA